jgi:hypothetical protein
MIPSGWLGIETNSATGPTIVIIVGIIILEVEKKGKQSPRTVLMIEN